MTEKRRGGRRTTVKPGDRHGRLVVDSLTVGLCQWTCDCGTRGESRPCRLTNGNNKSCGCLRRDNSRQMARGLKAAHDCSGTAENSAWHCKKKLGLLCADWAESFEAFFAGVGPRPSPKHKLLRVDKGRLFEPGNCRWATMKEFPNRRAGSGSGYIGVFEQRNRFSVRVYHDGRRHNLGSFGSAVDAAKARDRFLVERGIPAALNFPEAR